jgi:hypothetical protein
MSSFDGKLIKDRIQRAAQQVLDLPEAVAADVAFHMTDWLDDLEAYVRFCSEPKALTDKQVSDLLMAVLVHVPNHLAAAAKLYTGGGVTDVSGVRATTDETDE